jgi:hypothetical protein
MLSISLFFFRLGCLLHHLLYFLVVELFLRLEFHECFCVVLEVADHVLLKKKVVSSCQMVVLIVFDRLEQTFSVKPLLSFKVFDDFLI